MAVVAAAVAAAVTAAVATVTKPIVLNEGNARSGKDRAFFCGLNHTRVHQFVTLAD